MGGIALKKITITTAAHPFFTSLWEVYETSFPLDERRSLEQQISLFSRETYHLEAWVKAADLLGLIAWWDGFDFPDGLRFVEHFALAPACRGAGYGSAFLLDWIRENQCPVLLEIEVPVDETTRRREAFYRRLGFQTNRFEHWHPSYQDGTGRVELRIMSYPAPLSELAYQHFFQKLHSEMIPYPAKP
jgi:GNAT superfamily N-acetyltransferase